MPVLVRWVSSDGESTVRADVVNESTLGEEFIMLVGVRGLEDNAHKDLQVHTLHIRKNSVRYMADAVIVGQQPSAVEDKSAQ